MLKKYFIIIVLFILSKPIIANSTLPKGVNKPIIEKNYSYDNFKLAKYGLTKEVFDKAIRGYIKLLNKKKLQNKRYLTICDMSQSYKNKRFYVIDLVTKKIRFCLRVSHGKGSGEEYATKFSNIENSHQTSLGFYLTGGTYEGANGISLKLNGLEAGFNDKALERAIVLHGSEYVTDEYFTANNNIGRSWGCPAVSAKVVQELIKVIKNGSCLFVYHPNIHYNKKSNFIKS